LSKMREQNFVASEGLWLVNAEEEYVGA